MSDVSETAPGYTHTTPSPEKSSFSNTCNQGSLGLGIALACDNNASRSGTRPTSFSSMNLFPWGGAKAGAEVVAKAGDYRCAAREPDKGQMTIFYGGQVMVFNDLPASVAVEVMRVATLVGSQATGNPVPAAAGFPVGAVHESIINIPPPVLRDIPIARKRSLARFLEKRKDRIMTRSPYTAMKDVSLIPLDKSWLGLAGS